MVVRNTTRFYLKKYKRYEFPSTAKNSFPITDVTPLPFILSLLSNLHIQRKEREEREEREDGEREIFILEASEGQGQGQEQEEGVSAIQETNRKQQHQWQQQEHASIYQEEVGRVASLDAIW